MSYDDRDTPEHRSAIKQLANIDTPDYSSGERGAV